MSYTDCQKVVDATLNMFAGTGYGIEFYLDAEMYFTLNGEWIEDNELPENLRLQFEAIVETLEIEY
jgi:hypothetical protein